MDRFAKINRFVGNSLREKIRKIESDIVGAEKQEIGSLFESFFITKDAFHEAQEIKQLSAEINVKIHALGILLSLPNILDKDEVVEYVSLGAGNTGRKFDLETDKRIAEFKFIDWKGGSESIRQNGVFKDFYSLQSHETHKRKFLYLNGTEVALKFLRGGRSVQSVLSRNSNVHSDFLRRFAGKYASVGEYFADHSNSVELHDVREFLNKL